MTDVYVSSEDVIVTVEQPSVPPNIQPPNIGLVEISQAIQRGSMWLTGSGPPTTEGGQIGDMYLDVDTGDIYQWTGTEWDYRGTFAPTTLTPEEILEMMLTVDGAGSGLDADLLDGQHGAYYATKAGLDANSARDDTQDNSIQANTNAITGINTAIDNLQTGTTPAAILAKLITVDGPGSGLDADTLDGHDTAYFATQAGLTAEVTSRTNADTALDAKITTEKNRNDAQDTAIALRLTDAPSDANAYGRKGAAWVDVTEEAPSDGLGYMRKNGVWTPSSGGATTDDLPPAGPLQDGQFWWKSSTGVLYLWYDDNNSQQWVQVSASPQLAGDYQPKTARVRNRVTNPAMQVNQELGAGGTNSANNGFVADQWMAYWSTTGVPVQGHRQDAVPVDPDVDWFFRFSQTTADTSIAATEFYTAISKIEGLDVTDFKWGTPQAVPAVFRIKVRSVIAGNFGIRISANGSTPAHFVKKCTITTPNVWTWFTFAVPPPTLGTAMPVDNTQSISINVTAMAGANYNGGVDGAWQATGYLTTPDQTNWMSVANTQFLEFTNVGLYADPDNTGLPPPWETPEYAAQLVKCKRYWNRFNTVVVETNAVAQSTIFPVSMRTAPTLSGGGTSFTSQQLTTESALFYQAARAGQTLVLNARM